MLIATVQACTNIFSSNPYCFLITKQNKLVSKFNIIREEVIKIHIERLNMLEEFNIKFETLVQEYFPEPRQLWKIKPDDEPMLKTDYLSSNAELLQHMPIKRRMRMLFFGDFLSFSYGFFSTLYSRIEKKEIRGGCLNINYREYLFLKLKASPKFAKQNAINIKFLYDIRDYDISFTFLLQRLEKIVGKRTSNSIYIIREILYLNPNFQIDINRVSDIRNFHYIISYYFSRYGRKDMPREPEKFIAELHRVAENYYEHNGIAVLTEILKSYREYLKIDIKKEFETSKQQEADPRFITYTKNQEDLKKCCINENTNLIDVSCEEHQNIIDEIRLDYSRNINIDLRSKNSYFQIFIVYSIEHYYRNNYKRRVENYSSIL
ncbi:hypothetical protein CDIK_3747 [Cucumispora dikerogammari]|nr:hypothetical protein CDIK_3747 [Cucumispora dikerogammari]